MYQPYNLSNTVGRPAIRVVCVVVVDVAGRVDVPRIISVAPVRRAQPRIDSGRIAYSLL